jgi:hypothetical protein
MRMTLSHSILAALGALALASTTASALPAVTGAAPVQAFVQDQQPVQVQYYYRGPRRYYGGGPRYAYRGGYYRRGYRGDGVAAGVAAGAIGALAIGGLAASGAFDPGPRYAPMAPSRKQWCADRYRSYNPEDGTFVGRDGRVRFCG